MIPVLAVEVRELRKSFGGTAALDGVDLEIRAGTVFGLLGPNGAGKTTTIRILTTLLEPDSGSARVAGHDVVEDPAAVRAAVGLTGQFATVDETLSGVENLVLVGRLLGFSRARARLRAEELLAAFDLTESGKAAVSTYSGGMARRIDIAASLVVPPALLFLDEPTANLDPRSRQQVWSVVSALAESGTTIVLTSNYLDEIDHLAARVAVIDRGRIVAEGTNDELKASVGSGTLQVFLADPGARAQAAEVLDRALGTSTHLVDDVRGLLARADDEAAARAALDALAGARIEVTGFSLSRPTLDEAFLALTGHGAAPTTEAETR